MTSEYQVQCMKEDETKVKEVLWEWVMYTEGNNILPQSVWRRNSPWGLYSMTPLEHVKRKKLHD